MDQITTNKNAVAYQTIMAGLRNMGYQGPLLQEGYAFGDWFSPQKQERKIAAAAFGQTPISYDSACLGIVLANGLNGPELVDGFRALGAPIILEISGADIFEWAVSATPGAHGLIGKYPISTASDVLSVRATEWRRDSLFRAKNISSFRWTRQLGLFAGLLPELESHIQSKLDPLLRETLSVVQQAYRESSGSSPDPADLFKLVFWILTAKVFRDRDVPGFSNLTANPDALLQAVGHQYRSDVPSLLNKEARAAAAVQIWNELDFRNLSVEVLCQIWSSTLVDSDTRKRLGIHRTSRTIVSYMVERIPFDRCGDEGRIIFEPCSGSAGFLIGVMNVLRKSLFGMTPSERHTYFVNHLAGMEKDPFGVEISRLALTLADFPNPDGWDVTMADVFATGALSTHLRKAAVVLCNPPFENFKPTEREKYSPSSVRKPDELLRRVLKDLPADGVIGFVLPRIVVDGRGYSHIRKELAQRFGSIDITLLPDRAFSADSEIALLVATEPFPHGNCKVSNCKVLDNPQAWNLFEIGHQVSSEFSSSLTVEDAEGHLTLPDLPEVWEFLVNYPTLAEVADVHRGIEWNIALTADHKETGNREILVRDTPAPGFRRGIAPKTTFRMFETPPVFFLNSAPEYKRGNAEKWDWDKPKVILKKSARSRGKWRIAAFPDSEGIACYQTFTGVWPKKASKYDEVILCAVLNSPVANAFVSAREGKTDITKEVLGLIPIPHLTEPQVAALRSLVAEYQAAISEPALFAKSSPADLEALLKRIDALVLDGYRMPANLEHEVLEFFRGSQGDRPTVHNCVEYFTDDLDLCFSLSDRLSPRYAEATSGRLFERMGLSV